MNITEIATDGLRREFQIVIPAAAIEEKVTLKLEEIRREIRMPGFRPGKVPFNLVNQRHRPSAVAEVIEALVGESIDKALGDRNLKPALQPRVEAEKGHEDGVDFTIKVSVEVLPEIEPGDLSVYEIERPVAEIAAEAVEQSLARLAEVRKTFEKAADDHAAQEGDSVVIDFKGTVDGVAKPGMDAEAYPLELGAGRFIPGFEPQLVGVKAGEHRTVTVTFPADYGAADLAGKEAVFEIDAKEVRTAKLPAIDDELAKGFGAESLEKLRADVRERMVAEYGQVSRRRAKRRLLDKMAAAHSFEVPPGMVDIEFEAIWRAVQDEIKAGNAPEDAAKSEDELKAEYRAIAERRVRLGLVLSEIGRRNKIEITQDELNRALYAELRRHPGQEKRVVEFYKSNPRAVDALRAPIFEDKVVDFILELAKVSNKTVPVEELMREDEDEEAVAA